MYKIYHTIDIHIKLKDCRFIGLINDINDIVDTNTLVAFCQCRYEIIKLKAGSYPNRVHNTQCMHIQNPKQGVGPQCIFVYFADADVDPV